MTNQVRSQPCSACPYRRDAPSGLWAEEEYDKLVLYDAPMVEQPPRAFCCHATPEKLCHGWAVVASRRGTREVLALRMRGIHESTVPSPAVPLFETGAEAAAHGKRDLDAPTARTLATARRLMRKYPRLR